MHPDERLAMATAASVAVREVAGLVFELQGRFLSKLRRGPLGRIPGVAPVTVAVEHGGSALHAGIRSLAWAGSEVVAPALGALTSPGTHRLAEGDRGRMLVASLGAAFGDHLSGHGPTAALAPPLSLYLDGRAVSVAEYCDSLDGAGPRIVVFLHGLGGTEVQWGTRVVSGVTASGCTALLPRYTSGLPIWQNGDALAMLLSELVTEWPLAVEQIVLVGHSMGGLVARRACETLAGTPVEPLISNLVTLGSPHGGSPIEKVADLGMRALASSHILEPVARFGNLRSIGIKDLRHGAMRPEDWGGMHPDEAWSDTTAVVRLPSHIRQTAVVAAVSQNPAGLLSWLIGDGIVRTASASGHRRDRESVTEEVITIAGTSHLALLSSSSVAEILTGVTDDPRT